VGLRGQRTTSTRSISAGTSEPINELEKPVRALRCDSHAMVVSRDVELVRLRATPRARAQTGVTRRVLCLDATSPNTKPHATIVPLVETFGIKRSPNGTGSVVEKVSTNALISHSPSHPRDPRVASDSRGRAAPTTALTTRARPPRVHRAPHPMS
jgi:hypothetical protein